jgi:xylulokinase
LLDLERKEWSQELLEAFDIRPDLLPELYPSTYMVGGVTNQAAKECGLLEGTPVILGGGDGSCACVGAGVVRPGKAYNVVGSSSWISMAAERPYFAPKMRTFNWVHLDEKLYTPCGTMQAAGYSYAWFRNTLGGEEMALAKEKGISAYPDFTVAETFTQTQRVIQPNPELSQLYHCTYRHFRRAYDCLKPLYAAMAARLPVG